MKRITDDRKERKNNLNLNNSAAGMLESPGQSQKKSEAKAEPSRKNNGVGIGNDDGEPVNKKTNKKLDELREKMQNDDKEFVDYPMDERILFNYDGISYLMHMVHNHQSALRAMTRDLNEIRAKLKENEEF